MSRELKNLIRDLNQFHNEIERFRKTNNFSGRLETFSRPIAGGDGSHTVTTRFQGIPEKAVAPGKKSRPITVLLVGKLWLEANNKILNITKYNTEALYCDHKASVPNQLDAVHGFHFDYENYAPHAHPIFHAHYDLSASRAWYTDLDPKINIRNIDIIENRREHRSICNPPKK